MTLREFLTDIAPHEHYRVFIPNRDCLAFESFFTIHSPNYYDNIEEHTWQFKKEYYENNPYCGDIYDYNKEMDEETKQFLDKYGKYQIFSLEISTFRPYNKVIKKGVIKLKAAKDKLRPNSNYLNCFDIFICCGEEENYKEKYNKLYNAVKWRYDEYKKDIEWGCDFDGIPLEGTNLMITLNLRNVTEAILASVEEEE